jgi:hypothetical protein
MARTELASARLTQDEKELLTALASNLERSESDVIRRLIRDAAVALHITISREKQTNDQDQTTQRAAQ